MTTFSSIAVIGLGLIGSSICKALKSKNACKYIAGYDSDAGVRKRSTELGFADKIFRSPTEAVRDCEITVLCVPVGSIAKMAIDIAPILKPGSIITDVGSTKRKICSSVYGQIPDTIHFVPAHPVAGTQFTGPDAGFAELFDDMWCILTPREEDIESAATLKVKKMWETIGSRIEFLPEEKHDQILAVTSHVPHVIAYSLVLSIIGKGEDYINDILRLSAGGFSNYSRVSASSPTMWRDIFLQNKDFVMENIEDLKDHLDLLKEAINSEEPDKIFDLLETARNLRAKLP